MNRQANAFVSNLSQAARDNPVAAALIGAGALWLLLGNRTVGSAVSGVASVAQPIARGGMRGVANAADVVSSTAGSVAEATGRVADSAFDAARSMTRSAGEAAADAAAALRHGASGAMDRASGSFEEAARSAEGALPRFENPLPQVQRTWTTAQSALSDLFERQPLVLGALGLAIGAGVASAIASTAVENEWAGSASDELKEAATTKLGETTQKAQRAAGEVASEFRAAAGEAAEKLREAGQEAMQRARATADT